MRLRAILKQMADLCEFCKFTVLTLIPEDPDYKAEIDVHWVDEGDIVGPAYDYITYLDGEKSSFMFFDIPEEGEDIDSELIPADIQWDSEWTIKPESIVTMESALRNALKTLRAIRYAKASEIKRYTVTYDALDVVTCRATVEAKNLEEAKDKALHAYMDYEDEEFNDRIEYRDFSGPWKVGPFTLNPMTIEEN